MNIAYLAQGKLYLKQGHQAAREIESEFGQSVQQRRLQVERRQAMRNANIQGMLQSPVNPSSEGEATEAAVPVNITSICRVAQNQLLYTLESAGMGGLMQFDPSQEKEQRLFHNTEFQIDALDYHEQHQLLACTKNYSTGISNLATLDPKSHRPRDLTEGDSIDAAPRWVQHKPKAIVYQSAGVSRNGQGFVVNRAPFSIMELDFKKQAVITLAEDAKSDLLGPQATADGFLYYIRRPYKPQGEFNIVQFLKDLVLLPVRLLYAIFQFFNIFSQMTTGQPLMNATTRQKVEQKQPMRTLVGMFMPENLPKKHLGDADAPALVPPSWQLVRQGAQGVPEVIAKSVLSYDIAKDGSVVYTNGSGVYQIPIDTDQGLRPGRSHQRLLVGKLIESVTIL